DRAQHLTKARVSLKYNWAIAPKTYCERRTPTEAQRASTSARRTNGRAGSACGKRDADRSSRSAGRVLHGFRSAVRPGSMGIVSLKIGTRRFTYDRKSLDALRRRLVARVLGGIYRPIESTIRRNGELAGASIRRIVVCRPNHRLGNALLLTPLILELERSFPDAKIDLVLGGGAGPAIFQDYPTIGSIACLPRYMVRHPLLIAGLAWKLRKARYDLAIDPCDGSQSGRLLLVIARALHSIGTKDFDSNRDPESQVEPAHLAQLPVFLLRNALSPQAANTDDYPPLTLRLTSSERQKALTVLETLTHEHAQPLSRATVGIFAGATGGKRFDAGWWSRFVGTLRAQHADVAIVELGSENGQTVLPSLLPSFFSPNIREAAAFISNMQCFVSADCGVMHLAAASGATTVGLFSTTDPAKYEPYGRGSQAIDTNGKSPEEVAQLVASIVGAGGREIPVNPAKAGWAQT
ncbi:MAG TPA: glycosyltransferase family 9 protein, partial [Xanthomonadaceae bacterium]|nr:glycosyltransferase family 9 protein [Xanthomonadaceae bacterium]